MRRVISIGLFVLLMYQMLGYVLACVTGWWQAEHDLTKRLVVYRATDSLVEFQIPLTHQREDTLAIARTTAQGFAYRGQCYEVVNLEVRRDTLFILGVDFRHNAWWRGDLLSFLNDHIAGMANPQKKANPFLKLLLTEYSLNPRAVFHFRSLGPPASCPVPDMAFRLSSRCLPIHSPPPEA